MFLHNPQRAKHHRHMKQHFEQNDKSDTASTLVGWSESVLREKLTALNKFYTPGRLTSEDTFWIMRRTQDTGKCIVSVLQQENLLL